jgi:hypothetical protein
MPVKVRWNSIKSKRGLRRLYLSVLPAIRKVAKRCGYAIGVHGSLTRDFDLIAAPWIERCVSPAYLASRIEEAVCQYRHPRRDHFEREDFQLKPHGRIAFCIHLGTHAHIDLSVMPFRLD